MFIRPFLYLFCIFFFLSNCICPISFLLVFFLKTLLLFFQIYFSALYFSLLFLSLFINIIYICSSFFFRFFRLPFFQFSFFSFLLYQETVVYKIFTKYVCVQMCPEPAVGTCFFFYFEKHCFFS